MQKGLLLSYDTKRKMSILYRRVGIFVIFVLMFIICCSVKPDVFLTKSNLINIMRQMTVVMLIAMSECMVLINGTNDLSPGAHWLASLPQRCISQHIRCFCPLQFQFL